MAQAQTKERARPRRPARVSPAKDREGDPSSVAPVLDPPGTNGHHPAETTVADEATLATRRRTRGSRGGRRHKKSDTKAADVAAVEAPPEKPKRAPRVTAKQSAPPAPTRRTTRKPKLPEPTFAYDDAELVGPKATSAPAKTRIPVTGAPVDVPPPFAHNAEYEFARILDFYGIAWEYEPRSFPLRWERGHVTEAFTPDFYLPDLDLFVELTTLKSGLTAEKNRKMRILQELYPDTNIIMLKKRDYLRLLAKYGYGAISPAQVPDIDHVLIPTTKLQQRVVELGEQISKDYVDKEPVLVGVLRGVMCFIADVMRQISLPTSVDFMSVSSYDGNTASAVRILKDLELSIKGRDVILVEDIVDTGMTLNHVIEYLQTKRPASIKVCTLLDKRARRLISVPIDYVGFEIPDEFVVGYGLDFHQRFRNLPFIGVLKHELLP
jgi:hypoxanthine phosphoribosyltransferase